MKNSNELWWWCLTCLLQITGSLGWVIDMTPTTTYFSLKAFWKRLSLALVVGGDLSRGNWTITMAGKKRSTSSPTFSCAFPSIRNKSQPLRPDYPITFSEWNKWSHCMSACQTSEVTNFVGHALLSFVLAFVYSYPVLHHQKERYFHRLWGSRLRGCILPNKSSSSEDPPHMMALHCQANCEIGWWCSHMFSQFGKQPIRSRRQQLLQMLGKERDSLLG